MKQNTSLSIKEKLIKIPKDTYMIKSYSSDTSIHSPISSTTQDIKNGKGLIEEYHIFPGIHLSYLYFLGDHMNFHHDADNSSLEINHCHQGRIGIHMKGNQKVFLGEGDMAFQPMNCCADANIEFPLGFYEGITITMNLATIVNNPVPLFTEDFAISKILAEKFCANNKPVAIPANHRIEHIFCELYSAPIDYKQPYMKLKILELILFLYQLEPDEKSILKPFFSEQVEIIKEIHKKLTSNLTTRITIEELSSEYLINATTLKNTFKSIYGLPIATYMKKYRIDSAASILRQSNVSISSIAANVGYESQGKFTQAFKDQMGMSPSDYRKQYMSSDL